MVHLPQSLYRIPCRQHDAETYDRTEHSECEAIIHLVCNHFCYHIQFGTATLPIHQVASRTGQSLSRSSFIPLYERDYLRQKWPVGTFFSGTHHHHLICYPSKRRALLRRVGKNPPQKPPLWRFPAYLAGFRNKTPQTACNYQGQAV